MPLLPKRIFWPVFLALIFVLSVGSLAYAWWLFQIARGNQASRAGDLEAAAEIYQGAEAPFRRLPWVAHLLRDDFQRLTFNQIRLLYAQGQNDEVMDKLEEGVRRAPLVADSPEYSFWLGNVLLRRAIQSKNPEEKLKALNAALEEYEKGLAAEPEDWDLKYNYELVKHVLSQRGQDKKEAGEKVKSILDRMRPTVDSTREVLPPEKRG
jgi:tetratricopeptide (TPR) repeat protein